MRIFKRIDRKLLFCFLITPVVAIGIITLLTYNRGVAAIKKETEAHLRLISIAIKGHISTFIKTKKDIAREFASDRIMIQSLKELSLPAVDPAPVIEGLNTHMVLNKMSLYSPDILAISILNTKGRVVFSTDETKIGADESERKYFYMVKHEGYFGDIHLSKIFLEPIIEVSSPIIDRETGIFYGVVVITFSGNTLAEITRSLWLEESRKIASGLSATYLDSHPSQRPAYNPSKPTVIDNAEEIYIVNKEKRIIARSLSEKDTILEQIVDTKPVQMALTNGEEILAIYKNYRGVPIIGASAFIKETGWVILIEKDISETFAPLFRLRAQMITLGIAALGIVVLLAFQVSRGITAPIKRLMDAMQKRSEGDTTLRVDEVSDDDLGVLTASFNKMCDDIEKITVSKDYMEKVFASITESLIITDMYFDIKRINPATTNILGYSEAELIGKPLSMLFKERVAFLESVSLNDLIYDQITNSYDVLFKAKDGKAIPINLSVSVVRDCKHKYHPQDCPNHKRISLCGYCPAINLLIVGRDMRPFNTLIQKEQERIFELTTIQDISRELGFTLHYDDLFKLILNSLHTAIRFDIAGSVFCNNPDDLIYVRQTASVEKEFMDWYQDNLLKTFGKLSADEHKGCKREFINISTEHDKTNPANNKSLNDKIRSYFNVPLIVKERIVGIINISSFEENAFTSNHIRMLYTVANQAMVSIQHLTTIIEYEKDKITSILRDIPVGVIMIAPNGVIDIVNPEGERLLRYLTISRQGDVLTHLSDYYLKEPINSILSNKSRYISQEFKVSREDESLDISMITSPIKGKDQNIGVVIVLRDITNERTLQRQLLHTEKLSSIGEMVSGIAHEINNPLAGIMGLTQLLQMRTDLTGEIRKTIDKIFSYTDRTKRIIQNLLTFARSHKTGKTHVNINSLIEQTIDMHEYNMKVNDIEILKDLEAGLPDIIADMYQLQQVFFNIIKNAYDSLIEYDGKRIFTIRTRRKDTTPARMGQSTTLSPSGGNAGGVSPLPQQGTKPEDERLIISFHNTGHLIPKEIMKRIFDPFFTTKEVGKGTGMGLSISFGIIKDHGGTIYAINERQGVTFYIELPLNAGETGKGRNRESEEHESREIEESTPLPGMNILIIEDEKEIAHSTASLLGIDGHTCDIATNGSEAIERIKTHNYDLIISDIKMPVLDGKEVYAYLKSHKSELAERFVVITGDVMNPETKSFIEKNHIPCLAKPYMFEDLKKIVAEAIRME